MEEGPGAGRKPNADKEMPRDVRAAVERLVDEDPGVAERYQRLHDHQLAKTPPVAEGRYSPAQRSAATGFARKRLAQELGLWDPEQMSVPEPIGDLDIDALLRPRRQSRGLSAEQRKAVESWAVSLAMEALEAEGWVVEDVGATRSYDLRCHNSAGESLVVEVKGTTGGPNAVDLTANEVAVARLAYPNTELFVVHDVVLDRGDPPEAAGGAIHRVRPWRPEDDRLEPMAYRYRLS